MINNNKSKNYQHDYLIKSIVVGEPNVGKSSFILRTSEDYYTESFISTIGVDFKNKNIEINEDKKVRIQIWDLYNVFYNRPRPSYRGSHVVFLLFDLTNLESLNRCQAWVQEIDRYCFEKVVKILVGTKLDQVDFNECDRAVSYDMARDFADEYEMTYIEISSKYNINVEDCVMKAVEGSLYRFIYPKEKEIEQKEKSLGNKQKQSFKDKCKIN